MARVKPIAVPNTSHSAATTKELRAALSSARKRRYPPLRCAVPSPGPEPSPIVLPPWHSALRGCAAQDGGHDALITPAWPLPPRTAAEIG